MKVKIKAKLSPRKLMELAIEVMRQSVREPRTDGKVSPKVGVVLVKPDSTVETACRGELRHGNHAEFTLSRNRCAIGGVNRRNCGYRAMYRAMVAG